MKFTEIEPQNYRQACALSVKPQQQGYLSSAPMILARAYAFRQQNSQVWLIEAEEEAVGIIMIREADQGQTIVLDQFFIDQCFQGRNCESRRPSKLFYVVGKLIRSRRGCIGRWALWKQASGMRMKFCFRLTGIEICDGLFFDRTRNGNQRFKIVK